MSTCLAVPCDSKFCNNIIDHLLLYIPKWVHQKHTRSAEINANHCFRYSANDRISGGFNNIYHFAQSHSEAFRFIECFFKVAIFLHWIRHLNTNTLIKLLLFSIRNHFLRGSSKLNGASIRHKEQTIGTIKFIGHQHLLLTDIINQLNFCYSLKVCIPFESWKFYMIWLANSFN